MKDLPVPSPIIRWADLEQHLQQRIEATLADLDKAEGDRAVGKAQGRLAAYREMKNLPQTLRMLTVHPEGETSHG